MCINVLNKIKETLLCQTENKINLNVSEYFLETLKEKKLQEVCLSCSALPFFKYRILFIAQEPDFEYPLTIYLDECIAEELHIEEKIFCLGKEQFEDLMIQIMGSDKIDRVIKKLLEN